MAPEDDIREALQLLSTEGLLRVPNEAGTYRIDASSNDYLGLASRSVSRETLLTCVGKRRGSGASRLLQGDHAEHGELERLLANWVRLPRALVFASGYAANVGLLSAIGGAQSVILSDALNHASIIDGCRLSKAATVVVPHLDLQAMRSALVDAREAASRWVVTESYFSMDAHTPDLAALRKLCDEYDAGLIVDEAHALGVFGERGSGLCAASRVQPDVVVGTLGKAVGVQGAFVAGSNNLRSLLWNRARSFVFSTGISPVLACLTTLAVGDVQADDAGRLRLLENAAALRAALKAGRAPLLNDSHGPIVPIVLGDNARTLAIAESVRASGVLVHPIRPPTVPNGSARLRVTVKASWALADVDFVANSILRALQYIA
jgi:8-amino-7-oxononanoate synthase